VKGRTGYFMIALLLTILNAAVTVYSGVATWKAWPTDSWDRGLLVLLVVLGATSLANVWAQVVPVQNILLGGRSADREQIAVPIPIQVQGHADV
jgi:hypothetical protein